MATVRWVLGIICLVVFGGTIESSGNFLRLVDQHSAVGDGRKVEGLGIMLCSDQNSLSFAKYERQSPVPAESKKQLHKCAIGTAKPQTQWFCVDVFTVFNISVASKTKCQCFFDAWGFVKRHLKGIDKHFCILLMRQKFDALRHRADHMQYSNVYNSGYVSAIEPSGNFLRLVDQHSAVGEGNQLKTENAQLPTKVLQIARSQLGIREATGHNDGLAVETYLRYTGNKKGEPWCASFISWVFGRAGYAQPRTAWSPALFPQSRSVLKPAPAHVFGIYYNSLKRIAHAGLVEKVKGNWIQTIEGNTNGDGSREGNGVYRKLRHQRTIALYADWFK